MLKFMCPNGHQLAAPEERAGKPGKCPKCQEEFVVPSLEDVPTGEEIVEEVAQPETDVFVFLCPNGHKLNGPATLKGKPGKCPHCDATFMIPDDDEIEDGNDIIEDAEIVDDDIPTGDVVSEVVEVEEVEIVEEEIVPPPPAMIGHPLGDLLLKLWNQTDESQSVDLFVKDGATITIERYSGSLSSPEFGVFAVDEAGSYTIISIPWTEIARFQIRNVQELPKGGFR
ncbi:MAG: hypothetical protein ACI9G1_001874 [Pirellulaceae bacterium]